MKRVAKFLLSVMVTFVFTWWAFHDAHWGEQWASLKAARYVWVLPYFLLFWMIHLVRTLRWGCLLSRMERVPFKTLNEASGIGFMMLLVLPFRLGEFARPLLIARRTGIRRSAAMATVVLERIVDGMALAILLRVLLFFVPASAPNLGLLRLAANVMFSVFAGGLLFLLFSLWQRERAVAFIRSGLGRFSSPAAARAAETVDQFVGAIRLFPSGGQAVLFAVYTCLYWGINAWGMTVLARAFDCGVGDGAGCMPFGLTLFRAFLVMGVLVVGVMIPSAPGMIGTFQAAVRIGLALFLPAAVVTTKGLAYANVLWFCQTTGQILLGLFFMARGHLSMREVTQSLSNDRASAEASDAVGPRAPATR